MDTVFSQLSDVHRETATWLQDVAGLAGHGDAKQSMANGRMVLGYLMSSSVVAGREGMEVFQDHFDDFTEGYEKVMMKTNVHDSPFNLSANKLGICITEDAAAAPADFIYKTCFGGTLSLDSQPPCKTRRVVPPPQPQPQPRANPLLSSSAPPASTLFSSVNNATGGPANPPFVASSAASSYPRPPVSKPPPSIDDRRDEPRKPYCPPQVPQQPEEDRSNGFVTASRQLEADDMKRGKLGSGGGRDRPSKGKTLGVKRAFVPPFKRSEPESSYGNGNGNGPSGTAEKKKKEENSKVDKIPPELLDADGNIPDRLKNIEPELLETVCNEILTSSYVAWSDIAGLDHAKRAVYEAIIWPLQRPDLFKGIRKPTKGLLLFGPPGTGKTMIGKAIASESQSTFFNISASTLMSKWVGEGEKMVRALFAVASIKQPSVVFIDEVDSLLTQRCDGEQDHTRRLKTEFLVQLDGAGTGANDRILIVGATNRPQELDEAARRRMEKRLFISLPDETARGILISKSLAGVPNSIEADQLSLIVKKSKGYSGADLTILCREAALWPLREEGAKLQDVDSEQVRPVVLRDFAQAFMNVKPTVSEKDIVEHIKFNESYGSFNERTQQSVNDEVDHFFDDV